MSAVPEFNWKKPDYVSIFQQRIERLNKIRSGEVDLLRLKAYYKDHIADFINDWGVTADPRLVEKDLPAVIPFILFQKQRDWIDWFVAHWRGSIPGITEKSRDVGMSWLAIGASCALCLFNEGMAIGFGSRKEEYVDRIGSPKSLFFKARMFMTNLPPEFRGDFDINRDAPHMRINFPESNSNMSGEAGDNIGRGDRTSIYIVDESAFLERPDLIEASLSQTTNCRIDVSSVNGMNNPFAQKRFAGKIDVFTFHWRDDPRKDDKWYQKQCEEIGNPVIVASEIDIDYSASVEGVLIPNAWVRAAVDAHKRLKVEPSGMRFGALDVADEGRDKNAYCGGHGILIEHCEEWSGKGDDIFGTVQRAFAITDDLGYDMFRYDADGLGAGVRGDARIINLERRKNKRPLLDVEPFRGSAAVLHPEAEDVKERKNKDFFANAKAQAWWSVRVRFQKTYRAIMEHQPFDPDEIISISSDIPNYHKLITELSQPTYTLNLAGKILVDKAPEGTRSPNLADSVVMRYAGMKRATMKIKRTALLEIVGRNR